MKTQTAPTATYNSILYRNQSPASQGVFIATPVTGLVRIEWALARFGQVIPCNWSTKQAFNNTPSCAPLGYLVADAQNLAVRSFLESQCEWFLSIEHDNIIPPDCFVRLNDYVRRKTVPVVSGLYFTKSVPAEPLVYRGRGNGYFADWKIGDKVWVDCVPFGCVLIHRSLLQLLWDESAEYAVGTPPVVTRKVFAHPEQVWHDPERGWETSTGTSDMEWCSRIIVTDALKRAGWKQVAKRQYPFLIDTGIFVKHVQPDGRIFPSEAEASFWRLTPAERERRMQRDAV